MSLPIIVMPEAEDSLRRNARWWATHRSVEQAERWYNGMRDAIEHLADNPGQWPLARENDKFEYELREYHFGLGSRPTHRVLFTIQAAAVMVVSIRHAAQQDVAPDDL